MHFRTKYGAAGKYFSSRGSDEPGRMPAPVAVALVDVGWFCNAGVFVNK